MAPLKRSSESRAKVNGTSSKKHKTAEAAPAHKRIKTSASSLKPANVVSNDDSDDASWDGFDVEPSGNEEGSSEDQGSPAAAHQKPVGQVKSGGPEVHPDRKANTTSSRESHAKQKILVQERKAAKPNADMMLRSKKLWERLRRKSHVPLDERKVLVAELFEILTGRVKDFVFKHDAVRVVQTGVKYANVEQRKMIARELKGNYAQLAESRYAKFLIGKLLVTGDDTIRDIIVPEFYGKVRRLIKHPEASWILDDVYRGIATREQKAMLLCEWYGAEFALFKTADTGKASSDLSTILETNPEKRTPIMRSLLELLNSLIQKKLTGFTMLHDAMLQYFLNVKPGGEEMTEFIELVKGDEEGDLLKNLAFTKSGARLVCLALAYGTAKDRKQIIRTYKETVSALAFDTHGHLVLLAAFDVIDDTVLTSKSIFPELLGKDDATREEHIMNALVDPNARIPLLYPLAGRARWLFTTGSVDLEILTEIDAIRQSTSKKDPSVRRQELLKTLSPPLLQLVASQAGVLCQSSFGLNFVTEVLLSADGEKSAASEAVAELAEGDPKAEDHLAQRPGGGAMLKTLVVGGRFNPLTKKVDVIQPPLHFHNALYPYISKHLVAWATSPCSFVVLNLLEAEGFEQRDDAMAKLKKHRKVIEQAATEATAAQSRDQMTQTPDADNSTSKSKPGKKRKRATADGEQRKRTVGNSGAKLLLTAMG